MKVLSSCSKTIAGGFAFAFAISSIIALVLFNIQNHFMNPDTFKTVLDDQEIYDRLPIILSEQIAYSMTYNPCMENPEQCEGQDPGEDENDGPPSYLRNLTVEDWEQMLTLILTPEWTKSQAESIIDQFFDFLESDDEKLTMTISMAGLKSNLTGQNGLEFIRILINAQPPCTETFLGLLLDAAAGNFSPDQLLLCRPPDAVMDGLAPTMQAALDLVIDDLPNHITLRKRLFVGDESSFTPGSDNGPKENLQTVRAVMRFSPLLPLIFLVFLTILAVRSLKDLLFWWGIPLIVLGLSALGLGFVTLQMVDWGLETFVLSRIQGAIDPGFLELLVDSAKLLVQSLVRVIANQAVLITFLGIFMAGIGLLATYRTEMKS